MALGVDLFGKDQDGKIVWHWLCRGWSGHEVLKLVDPPPSEPAPSGEGPITQEQLEELRGRYGGREAELAYPGTPLDELLQIPVNSITVRVEEWGFG